MATIAELRTEARRLQRRANNKVSRLEANNVKIRFTEFDPRRDLKRIDKYNRKQLEAYNNTLRSFNSRRNSFVSSAEGRPIPSSLWREYKAIEARHNAEVDRRMARVANVPLPNSDESVADREAKLTPSNRRGIRTPQMRTHNRVVRDSPAGVMGARGLRKLMDNLKRKGTKAYAIEASREQRYNAMEMATRLGDKKLTDKIMRMSNEAFDLLWNYSGFANDMGQKYDVKVQTGRKSKSHVELSDDSLNNLHDQIAWANAQTKQKTGNKRSRPGNNYRRI